METIQGLDALLASMDELPRTLQKTLIVRALRKGAEPIRAQAQELAPIDETQTEHPLREGMMITVSEQSSEGAIAKIGPSRAGFYGGQQEFGNVNHAAQPFLIPAFEEKKAEAIALIGEELAAGIEREMRRL